MHLQRENGVLIEQSSESLTLPLSKSGTKKGLTNNGGARQVSQTAKVTVFKDSCTLGHVNVVLSERKSQLVRLKHRCALHESAALSIMS